MSDFDLYMLKQHLFFLMCYVFLSYEAQLCSVHLVQMIPLCPLLYWPYNSLKGTVSRDFLLLVFFLNQFLPSL
jgi:hypothetical protein